MMRGCGSLSWVRTGDRRGQCQQERDKVHGISLEHVFTPVDQTCARPPSTNSSMPVTKLESSDAKKSAALAISAGSAMRPIGIVDAIFAMASGGCRSTSGVTVGPGLKTLER